MKLVQRGLEKTQNIEKMKDTLFDIDNEEQHYGDDTDKEAVGRKRQMVSKMTIQLVVQ